MDSKHHFSLSILHPAGKIRNEKTKLTKNGKSHEIMLQTGDTHLPSPG